ncbi:Myocardin [Frankliniella fusca]|uniref:Myocardin n=1 Tax=Frankliniella fusca TaxID=407009 RepID=A0AAE1GXK3_9NEOP|nr:Myocardin [Frankliniella fusca]
MAFFNLLNAGPSVVNPVYMRVTELPLFTPMIMELIGPDPEIVNQARNKIMLKRSLLPDVVPDELDFEGMPSSFRQKVFFIFLNNGFS